MSRRVLVSTFGASALLVSGVAGVPAASALAAAGPTAPVSVAFGTVKMFETATRGVTVTVPAESTAVTFGVDPSTVQPNDDDFYVADDTCSDTTVQPGGTCTVTVGFNPLTDTGVRTADLVIDSTSPATTLTVALSGTAVEDATGTFYGITPTRFIDTRVNGTKRPLARNSTTTLQMGGRAGIPASGVSAVVINLTAVTTTSQGYFTVYPGDKSRPTASSINFPKGWTGANMVTVPVSPDGKVKLYNYGGAAHAIVDVLGWYAEDDSVQAAKGMGNQFFAATEFGDSERMYDSRQDPAGAFFGGDYIDFQDSWDTEAEARATKSYVVNVTAVDATNQGVLTLWNGAGSKPTVSSVNYVKGTIAPNMAVVPARYYTTAAGGVTQQNSGFRLQNTGSGSVDIVVDLVGYYVADELTGLRFVPRDTPKRLVDTRRPVGPDTVLTGAFGTTARTVNATSVTTGDSGFVVANTTGVLPTRRTYLTVWSGEAARPSASNLNVNPGVVRSASTYAPLKYTASPEKLSFNVYNNAGSMHLVMDVAGTFDFYPASTPAAAAATARAERSDGAGAGGSDAPGRTTSRDLPSVGDSERSFVRR